MNLFFRKSPATDIVTTMTGLLVIWLHFTAAGEKVSPTNTDAFLPDKARGVSWVAGNEVSSDNFLPLTQNHVNWIVQTPFGWQRKHDSTELHLITAGRIYWGETDAGLEATTRLARSHGLRVMLKPHIWLLESYQGSWRGEIQMNSEEEWKKWFENYRRFILHYADLAEQLNIEALCVGTELHIAAVEREADWRELISEIRKHYRGLLTYAANWHGEFEEIKFWDTLDAIGIQAYFPLSEENSPSLAELQQGWEKPLKQIEKIQKKYRKPVIFTEIGYRSTADAPRHPWEWPEKGPESQKIDLQTQARCYEAFFRTFWDKIWFAGVFWWKWFPNHGQAGGSNHPGFTPQNKPAEKVMAKWYGASGETGSE